MANQPRSDLPIRDGLRAQLPNVRRARRGLCDPRAGKYDRCDGHAGAAAAGHEGKPHLILHSVFQVLCMDGELWLDGELLVGWMADGWLIGGVV